MTAISFDDVIRSGFKLGSWLGKPTNSLSSAHDATGQVVTVRSFDSVIDELVENTGFLAQVKLEDEALCSRITTTKTLAEINQEMA